MFRTSQTSGPYIRRANAAVSDVTASLVRTNDLTTPLVASFDAYRNCSWEDVLSEPGAGSLLLMHDDPDLAAFTFDGNELIIMYYKGFAAWTMLVERYDQTTISQDEESEQHTLISGRGHLALFERMALDPSRGVGVKPVEEDRLFSWPSASYDHSTWPVGKQLQAMFLAQIGLPHWPAPWDSDFWAPLAALVGPPSGSINTAPLGTWYYAEEFTLAADGVYRFIVGGDNVADVYFDGQLIASPGGTDFLGYATVEEVTLEMTAGPHLVAARITNVSDAPANTNPTAIAWAIGSLDQNAEIATVLHTSSSAGRVLAYPTTPPGMTPGQVIRIVMEEAIARCVPGPLDIAPLITLAFDDNVDSAGVQWPVVGDISTRVGTDYLTFLRELAGTYIDVWLDPTTLTLYAWNIGTRGSTRPVALVPPADPTDATTGNITELAHAADL